MQGSDKALSTPSTHFVGQYPELVPIIGESLYMVYYWVILGVLSSIGLGSGLHTFLIFVVRMVRCSFSFIFLFSFSLYLSLSFFLYFLTLVALDYDCSQSCRTELFIFLWYLNLSLIMPFLLTPSTYQMFSICHHQHIYTRSSLIWDMYRRRCLRAIPQILRSLLCLGCALSFRRASTCMRGFDMREIMPYNQACFETVPPFKENFP